MRASVDVTDVGYRTIKLIGRGGEDPAPVKRNNRFRTSIVGAEQAMCGSSYLLRFGTC